MEKNISIIPEKKITQTNPDKKAAIQSILEKYNLKTPKKSKTNATPVNYEIKPKDVTQVIHVSKSVPSTPKQLNTLVNDTSRPVRIESQDKREIKSAPTSPSPQSTVPAHTPAHGKTPISEARVVSVKDLLEKDKAVKEAKKNEIPPAIIQKQLGGGNSSLDKINIYNFIPKVRTNIPDTHFRTTASSSNSNHSSNSILKNSGGGSSANSSANSSASGNIKRVSINPNLNEEESLNYTGQNESIISKQNIKNNHEFSNRAILETAARNKLSARTPSPIRNLQQDKIRKNIAHLLTPSETRQTIDSASAVASDSAREQRQIQIQTSNSTGVGGGKQLRALRAIQPLQPVIAQNQIPKQYNTESAFEGELEGENSGLRYLEAQRKELQRQQLLELQRFKQKKSEIIKLNNRKKEIELMRGIEEEKNKLRKIHAKQQELNEIYKTAVCKHARGNDSGGITMKNPTSASAEDYNVDAKRTKKNLAVYSKNKFIEPTENAHIKRGKLKYISAAASAAANVIDKIVLDKLSNKDDVVEVVQVDNEKLNGNGDNKKDSSVQSKVEVELIKSKETINKESSKSKVKKELVPGESLKYYTKKDKQNVVWPSKSELYDTSKFEDTLDIHLAMASFFNKKQIKNKATAEEISKELKEEYGFQKIDKFKPALLEVIYKIIIGDRIKFTFE